MLSFLVKQYICELFHALFFPHYLLHVSHTMSVHSTMFPVYRPFELERVMPVSSGIKTRSSNKTVLPIGGDSTPVVHAQEPALPHITQTLADCTPTAMDREPASPTLTPTQPIVTQFLLTQHHLHHRAPKQERLVRQLQCPKGQYYHGEPQLHQLVRLFLWTKHN